MSTYKRLFVWVEGVDDERFFSRILNEHFVELYDNVHVIRYAEMPTKKVKNYLKSIRSMDGADYILLADLNGSPCVTERKGKVINKFSVEEEKVVVVVREIESWYLAGLSASEWERLGMKGKCPTRTDDVTKEDFNSMISKILRRKSRIELLQEILEVFSTEVAMRKNKSFRYFMKKYCFNKP